MKKKLLLASLALVIVISVIAAAVAPAAATFGPQRPQPRNCGPFYWCDNGDSLYVNTCINSWTFDDAVSLSKSGGVRQYGNIVIVRWSGNVGVTPSPTPYPDPTSTPTTTPTYTPTPTPTSTNICSFYAIGVICGPAVVYVTCNNNGTLEKHTYNLDWCGQQQCGGTPTTTPH